MSNYDGADEFIREVTKERPGKERERPERERERSGSEREGRERERSGRERERERSGRERSERDGERAGGSSRGNLSDRLMAISAEEKPSKPPGVWLTEQMEKYKKENGIESDSEPTEEDIKNQVMLPTKEQVEGNSFKEPITNWVSVEPSKSVPSWSKAILPEEEIVRGPDWKPPTPPRVDISLVKFTRKFESETLPNSAEVLDKKGILSGKFGENEEICFYDNACIIRTTMRAVRKAERNGDLGDDWRREAGRGGRGAFRGERGGRGGSRRKNDMERNRSMSSSPGRDNNGDFRSRDQRDQRDKRHNRDHSDHHSRSGRSRSPNRDRRNERNSRDIRESRDERKEDSRGARNRASIEGRQLQGDRSHARVERRDAAPAGNNHQLAANRNTSRPSQAQPAQPAVTDGAPKTYKEYKEWKARQALLGLK